METGRERKDPMYKCTNLFSKFAIDKVTLEILLVFKLLDGN